MPRKKITPTKKNKNLVVFIAILLTLCLVFLLWRYQPIIIRALALSRQQTIDPANLDESFDPSARFAVFNNQSLTLPQALAEKPKVEKPSPQVLGESEAVKRIEVDLTNQRLNAFENDKLVYSFLVSTGKWARTPTGHFRIWVKLRYTKMSGGNQALGTYYYLPNVPYVMFFAGDGASAAAGFSLHGTYWHNNFGHPMSHGCINMKTEEAEQIYYWAKPDLQGKDSIYVSADNPGTEIYVYGEAPWE